MRQVVSQMARALELMADKGCDAIVAATPAIANNFRNRNVVLVQNFPWIRDFPQPEKILTERRTIAYVGAITASDAGLR